LAISRQKRGMAISVPPLEDVDDRRGAGAAQGVRQTATRPDDLPLAGLAAELVDDLDGLRDARRAYRLTAGLQPARRVHGDLAVQRRDPVQGRGAALPLLDEPQVLDREDFRDREVVVDLRDLDVLRRELRLVERALPCDDGRIHRRQVAPAVEGEEVARLPRTAEEDRRVCDPAALLAAHPAG